MTARISVEDAPIVFFCIDNFASFSGGERAHGQERVKWWSVQVDASRLFKFSVILLYLSKMAELHRTLRDQNLAQRTRAGPQKTSLPSAAGSRKEGSRQRGGIVTTVPAYTRASESRVTCRVGLSHHAIVRECTFPPTPSIRALPSTIMPNPKHRTRDDKY